MVDKIDHRKYMISLSFQYADIQANFIGHGVAEWNDREIIWFLTFYDSIFYDSTLTVQPWLEMVMSVFRRKVQMDDKKTDLSKKYWSQLREDKKRLLAQRTEKWCNHCQRVKPLDDFYAPSLSGLTGTSCWCRDCICQYARERRNKRRIEREMRKDNQC
jgi:hypothetical protein